MGLANVFNHIKLALYFDKMIRIHFLYMCNFPKMVDIIFKEVIKFWPSR